MKTFIKNKNTITFFLVMFSFFFFSINSSHALVGEIVGDIGNSIVHAILSVALSIMGFLFNIAALLFAWIVNPVSVKAIVGSNAVKEIWTTVRDLTNMFFILVLLFSAFSTVFQIEKYNIRRILLTLIIMALLVNFSYPISRAIIDISNIIMYDFLNQMFTGTPETIGATIGHNTGISNLLMPEAIEGADQNKGNMYMFFTIIYLFLLAVSLLAIGVILLLRLAVLAIVVMLSPVGFVGAIFPGFNKYSSQWWNALLKNAFAGPIMIFFLAASLKFMVAIGNDPALSGVVNVLADKASPNDMDDGFLGTATMMMAPIAMLWVGIAMAQKSGIAGASMAFGAGQRFTKWAGNLPNRGARKVWQGTGVPGAAKAAKDEFNKSGKLFGAKMPFMGGTDRQEAREASLKQRFGIDKNATRKLEEKKRAEDIKKQSDAMDGHDIDRLITDMDRVAAGIEAQQRSIQAKKAAGTSVSKEELDKLKKDQVTFMAMQKQARSRGSEYDDARKDLREKQKPFENPTNPRPVGYTSAEEANYTSVVSNPPAKPSPISPLATPAQVAAHQQATKDWEVETKEWEVKVSSLEKLRASKIEALKKYEKAEKDHYDEMAAKAVRADRDAAKTP